MSFQTRSNVQSGFDAFARSIESGESKEVLTRFWFYPTLPIFRIRQDVASFEGLKVAVFTEVMAAKLGAKTIDPKNFSDSSGETFARQMSEHFEEVSAAHPTIARLPGLLELVALAHSAELMQPSPDLSFWLTDFPTKFVSTPKEQELLHRKKEFTANNSEYSATIQGGVHLTALALRLKSGDPHALRDAVISTRPSAKALSWTFVSGAWVIPTSGTLKTEDALPLVAQAMFLADQKRFDDAFACLSRASEAGPDLKEEIVTCRAQIVFEREYSSLQKQANEWMSGAMLSIKNKTYNSQNETKFTTGPSQAGGMELAEAMKVLVEVQSRNAEPYLLVAALNWGAESEKGREVLNKGLAVVPQSGALHYFRAKFHLMADDRTNAVADLKLANNLLKTNDPSGLEATAKSLLAQIERNIEGTNWKKFADRQGRYSFEYPADWTIFTPRELREFMAEKGFEVPKEFEAEQGVVVVDPNMVITVGIDYKDVGEHVRHDQLREFWRRVASQPQDMERKHSPFFPGFKVKSTDVIDSPSGLRSEIRYQFPMNIMGTGGLVRGRKTGIYFDSADTCVVMIEGKAWDKQFDKVNERYFEHIISTLRIGRQ
jgi:hypothetical protein